MVEQDLSDQEQIALASQPEEASKKATEEVWAEKTFERLQEIRKKQNKVDEHGKSALQDLDDEEDAAYEEKIDLVEVDYDYILAAGLFGATLLTIVIYLIRSKKQRGGKQDDSNSKSLYLSFSTVCRNWLGVWTRSSFSTRI